MSLTNIVKKGINKAGNGVENRVADAENYLKNNANEDIKKLETKVYNLFEDAVEYLRNDAEQDQKVLGKKLEEVAKDGKAWIEARIGDAKEYTENNGQDDLNKVKNELKEFARSAESALKSLKEDASDKKLGETIKQTADDIVKYFRSVSDCLESSSSIIECRQIEYPEAKLVGEATDSANGSEGQDL